MDRWGGADILNVEPALIGPTSLSPYPNSGGMVSLRLSPGHMPISPSSHLDLNMLVLLLPS